MKLKQLLFLPLVFLAGALLTGCDKPAFHRRPSDQACIRWLHGQKIVLEDGWLFKPYWIIEGEYVKTFDIVSITPQSEGRSLATVHFETTDGRQKELRVEGEIVYRHHKKDDVVEFISFMPTRLLKLGRW